MREVFILIFLATFTHQLSAMEDGFFMPEQAKTIYEEALNDCMNHLQVFDELLSKNIDELLEGKTKNADETEPELDECIKKMASNAKKVEDTLQRYERSSEFGWTDDLKQLSSYLKQFLKFQNELIAMVTVKPK
jgi:hypothetical protein